MSDYEEPAPKMAKLDESYEELDDGQEEWLSESILTDDDYNGTVENENDSIPNTSQDETMMSLPEESHKSQGTGLAKADSTDRTKAKSDNIEETLVNMENRKDEELPGELGAFLIRKADGKVVENREEITKKSSTHSDDDGHDTDELLRMLGDDDQKVKKKEVRKIAEKKKPEEHSTDDEDFSKDVRVTRLKVAKKAMIKKVPTKAVPEETSDGDGDNDMSSDEAATVEKIFNVRPRGNFAAKSTTKTTRTPKYTKTVQTRVYRLKTADGTKSPVQKSPINKTLTKPLVTRSITKSPVTKSPVTNSPVTKAPVAKTPVAKTLVTKTPINEPLLTKQPVKSPVTKTMVSKTSPVQIKKVPAKTKNVTDSKEAMEDDTIDEEPEKKSQPIMSPEEMDEEVPSDEESLESDDESLYDELPSSDSDDFNDWFTLDIRAERAADYIPLLGAKAYEILSEEKERVSGRLASLRHSLSAVAEGSKDQADQLRRASLTIAEMDAALKAV